MVELGGRSEQGETHPELLRRAVDAVVTWYVGGDPGWVDEDDRPGSIDVDRQPPLEALRRVERFLVACDDLPPSVQVSQDPRVTRVPRDPDREWHEARQTIQGMYLLVRAWSTGSREVRVDLQIAWGDVGAMWHEFLIAERGETWVLKKWDDVIC